MSHTCSFSFGDLARVVVSGMRPGLEQEGRGGGGGISGGSYLIQEGRGGGA